MTAVAERELTVIPVSEVGDYRFRDYAEQAVSGEIIVCKWVRLAAERFLSDLDRQEDEEFDKAHRDRSSLLRIDQSAR